MKKLYNAPLSDLVNGSEIPNAPTGQEQLQRVSRNQQNYDHADTNVSTFEDEDFSWPHSTTNLWE